VCTHWYAGWFGRPDKACSCSSSWVPAVVAVAAATDRTKEFQVESVTFFVEDNLQRYLQGQDLLNVCDKKAGY
jgi:hypothetical protein